MRLIKTLSKRISEGMTAKLNFDYACNRGSYFGEYYMHGTGNEIISANIDPQEYLLSSGYPHKSLNIIGNIGRKSELDFCIIERSTNQEKFCIEMKWAGSSHCKIDNILLDLIRLQIIVNNNRDTECIFVLSGLKKDIDSIFEEKLLIHGTKCILTRPKFTNNGSRNKIKRFSIIGNNDHQTEINKVINRILKLKPSALDEISQISSSPISSQKSAPADSRFQTYAWQINPT